MATAECDLLCLDLPLAERVRNDLPGYTAVRAAAARASALSDPTRLRLALILRAGGELCGCDLAWISARAQNLVSHHVAALRTAGLVASRREGKVVFHHLTADGHALLRQLMPDPAVSGERV